MRVSDKQLAELETHFANYTAGPGWLVGQVIADLRDARADALFEKLRRVRSEDAPKTWDDLQKLAPYVPPQQPAVNPMFNAGPPPPTIDLIKCERHGTLMDEGDHCWACAIERDG
jgi:hypothetical protein